MKAKISKPKRACVDRQPSDETARSGECAESHAVRYACSCCKPAVAKCLWLVTCGDRSEYGGEASRAFGADRSAVLA